MSRKIRLNLKFLDINRKKNSWLFPMTFSCLASKIMDVRNIGNVEYENIGAEEATGDDAAPADDAAAAPAEGEEGAEGAEGGDDMSPVQGLTMTLMLIDTRIEELYNQILTELDEEKRTTAFEELTNLKVSLP